MFAEGDRSTHEFTNGRGGWLHVARGLVFLNGDELREGDGAKIEGERRIDLEADRPAEVLLFDLG
jgi:redox-sensitive bicupin YhaK (pirin superfamily)